jgi:hypothetical protein
MDITRLVHKTLGFADPTQGAAYYRGEAEPGGGVFAQARHMRGFTRRLDEKLRGSTRW